METRETREAGTRGNKTETREAAEREKAKPQEQQGGLGSGRYQCGGDPSNDQQAGTTRGHMHLLPNEDTNPATRA